MSQLAAHADGLEHVRKCRWVGLESRSTKPRRWYTIPTGECGELIPNYGLTSPLSMCST
jgi:hypothetical protein